MIRDLLKLMRPHQWVKNAFVFLPVFFSGSITNLAAVGYSAIGFLMFCFASSAVYCLNDVGDAEADRLHPKKCKRPVASGAVSSAMAILLMTILFVAAFLLGFLLPGERSYWAFAILAAYVALNIAYCIKLKQIALVDVFIVSFGFVLRVAVGGVASGIYISHWIVLMTFLLALFLSLCKRRDDVVIYNNTGVKPRKNITRYNIDFLNQATTLVATTMLICYIMYTVSPEVEKQFDSQLVYTTSIFVIAGLLRYAQITVVDKNSGSPTYVLMHDPFIYCCVGGWILSFVAIIYL